MFSLKKELLSLTRSEKLFVIFAMLTGFCISAEYSITRPASSSIFLSVFSAKALPIVWLVTIPFNLALVSFYNWLLPKIGALKITIFLIAFVIGINLLCAFVLPIFPELIFFHFCWKDLYILFMYQQLWSMIHSTIAASRAKYLYGVIFGFGTFAMVLGSILPSFFAVHLGSEKLFLATAPIYALLLFGYKKAFHFSKTARVAASMQATVGNAFSFVIKNRYLLGILLIVVCMQVSIALVEYQFNHYLETEVPQQDLRTSYFSGVLFWVHLSTLFLQVIGSLFLFSNLSVRTNHLIVPVILGFSALGNWITPCFAMATLGFIMIKSIDWSLFGVMREMLFIPLTIDEKFRAKAVIDVFAYRSSKAIASLFLLILQLYVGMEVFSYAKMISFVIFVAWLLLVFFLFQKKELQAPIESKA